MRDRVRRAIADRPPDLVVLNGGDVLWARSEVPPEIPTIVVVHNLEHDLYRRQIANLPFGGRVLSLMLEDDCRRLEAQELDGIRSATAAIFLSEEDLAAVQGSIGGVRSVVIPPVFDYEPRPRRSVTGARMRLGMFADFEWWPNKIGLEWFLSNVWPDVAQHCDLHLLGHGSESAARGVAGVTRHGLVADARDAFAACDLMIAPITDGAGIKVKVAEALYNRVPVVATPAAVSGVFTVSNPALKVFNDPRQWIDFLTSRGAAALAREEVPPAIRETFTIGSAAGLLGRLVPLSPRKTTK
jgi:hypothetical protein